MSIKKVKGSDLVRMKPDQVSEYPIAYVAFEAGKPVFYRKKIRSYTVRIWVDDDYDDLEGITNRKAAFCYAEGRFDIISCIVKRGEPHYGPKTVKTQVIEYDDIESSLPQCTYQLDDNGSFKKVEDQEVTN